MYRAKFLFFLILGSLTYLTIRAKNADSKISKPKNSKDEISLLFGKRLSEVEGSIKRFILTLAKPKSKFMTQTLEKTSLKGESIKDLVTTSTKLIVENLRSSFAELGVLEYNNSSEILVPDKNQTLISTLIHNGLVLICEIIDILLTGSYLGKVFLFGNVTSAAKFINFNWKKPRYIDFIASTDKLFIYVDCMTQDVLSNDLKQAVAYGSTHSANEVIDYLKKNIKKPQPSINNNTTQSFCTVIGNIKPGGFEKCVSDWDKIETCFQSRIKTSTKSTGFSKYMKRLFPRKWVNNVVDLNRNCRIKEDQNFECKIRKRPAGTRRQLEFIIKTVTGKSVPRLSPLSRLIYQFSRLVSKSPMVKSIVQDCCDYIIIYRQGEKRKTDLKKISKKDPKELRRYRKVSRSLDNYKNGVIQDLLNAVIESNQIPIYLEKSLSKVSPKLVGWPLFATILMCISWWINSLFNNKTDFSEYMPKANENMGISYDRNSQRLIEIREEFPDLKKRISREQALDNLLRAMNQVSSENRALNKKSAFTGALNNILLVSMFLETLSAISLLMTSNMQLSNGGMNGQSGQDGQNGHTGQSGQLEQVGQVEQDIPVENVGTSEEESEEDIRRKKRSFDPECDTTFVSDLPDVGILPLNNSADLYDYKNYENDVIHTNDPIFEIRKSVNIQYEIILVYRKGSSRFDSVKSLENDQSDFKEFNNTSLEDERKL